MREGQKRRLYGVEVAVGDGEGKCGEITRALVNVLAANEGEAERMAMKVFLKTRARRRRRWQWACERRNEGTASTNEEPAKRRGPGTNDFL